MRRYAATAVMILVLVSAWILSSRSARFGAGTPSMADIKQIVTAPARVTYTADGDTSVCFNGRRVASDLRVYHKAPNRHRIEYISGPLKGVVVVDDGTRTWRLDPKCKSVMSADASRSESQLSLLVRNYSIRRIGTETIAGRKAKALEVRSKSAVRKRLWIDGRTAIVLKSEEYAPDGKLISSTTYKSIDYKAPVKDSLFRRPRDMQDTGKTMTREGLSKTVGFKVVEPKYIPKGFRLDAYRLYDCPCQCGHKSAYIRYTNGMDSISVFETPSGTGCMKMPACKVPSGKCCIKDQTAVMTSGGKSFVVIGDVPSQELKRITDSLK